jgi:hypothetical protein
MPMIQILSELLSFFPKTIKINVIGRWHIGNNSVNVTSLKGETMIEWKPLG